ncbi:hypothetical protein CHU92_13225 [Flavobacterium cyanobacteriorum]|uniref:YdhG-like domain-containing protein n=1 Tax=Flavobacterium cyanobacteriorum TaxID=2022802 RepID=A0A255YV69_9FLAO|nr:YdeI/OmpD-associated family protein [Flavobacterium cyanobacteriorum]OYQ33102.1 hypothetical protein CHU92_13225 [Flavobacterium cyanobacteriorum]
MEKENKWDSSHLWAEELDTLKAVINKTPLVETIKWGAPVYTFNGKNVLGLLGFKNFFTLWFYKGFFLKDEAGVLVNANEGNTKSLRQWRFTSKEEINEKLILQYITEAIEVEKAGLEIKPEKKVVPVPQALQAALDADPALAEAFGKLTPGRQKDYNEYIASAKQEKTQLARLEKIKPMILEGKGLNDKYK